MKKRLTTFAMLTPVAMAGYYLAMAPPPFQPTGSTPTRRPTQTPAPSRDLRVRIFVLDGSSDEPTLSPQWVSIPPGDHTIARALDHLAQRSDSPLPDGTRIRHARIDAKGVLHLDMNAAFTANFPGGSTPESLAMNALCQTVAEFPGVQSVKITVMGKPIATLGGHLDLTRPLPVR